MTVLLVILFLGMLLVWAAVASEKRRHRGLAEWQATAHELGLKLTGAEDARSMGGMLNGVPVRVDFRSKILHTRQATDAGADYLGEVERTSFYAGRLPPLDEFGRRRGLDPIAGPRDAAIPESLEVREDTLARSLGRFVEGRDGMDGTSGDAAFDALVELPDMDASCCAALSFRAREQLRALIERGGQVRQGRVEFERRVAVSHDRAWLVPMLQSLSRLAQSLSVPADSLHRRLVDNATHDPIGGVRLKNLSFLLDPNTRTPPALVASTAQKLLSDVHAPVRLLAARGLPAEGRPVLCTLVSGPGLATPLRLAALQALDERGEPPRELLSQLLGSSPPELVRGALAIIAARQLTGLSAAVVECAQSEHASVRAAVASALGTLPAQPAQQVLIALLSDPSVDVQQASAEALGAMGSVAAVEPLLPLTEGLGRAQLRQAARAAIGRIQSRLGAVEAGRVSLATGEPLLGAVALVEAAQARVGEVSLAEEAELISASEEALSRARRTEP